MSASKSAHMAKMRKARALKREGRISALDTFERLYRQYRNERREVEALMRQDIGSGRPTITRERGDESAIVGGMSILASPRARVRDSFDARPARDRSTARPYSAQQAASDAMYASRVPARIAKQYPEGAFDCYIVRADGTRVLFSPAASRVEQASKRSRSVKVSASRGDVDRALMSAMGTIHDSAA